MGNRVTGVVTVRVEVEVTVGSWSGETTFNDLEETALREGKQKVAFALRQESGFRIVGEPRRMSVKLDRLEDR